jgi:hypothetical protein
LPAKALKAAKTSIFLETSNPSGGYNDDSPAGIKTTPKEAGNYELDAITRYELAQIQTQRMKRLKELRELPVNDLCSTLQAEDMLVFDMYLADTDKVYFKERYHKKVLRHFESCKSCNDAFTQYCRSTPMVIIEGCIRDWTRNALKAWRAQLKYNCPN